MDVQLIEDIESVLSRMLQNLDKIKNQDTPEYIQLFQGVYVCKISLHTIVQKTDVLLAKQEKDNSNG